MPQPQWGLLQNLPVADPVGGALSAYEAVSKERRAQRAAAETQKLQELQAQKAQFELKQAPTEAALKQQKERSANQAAQLQLHVARNTIHDTSLADLHQLPEDQKEAGWQNFKHTMASVGGDVSQLPAHYGPKVQAEAAIAFAKSSQAGEARKFQRDVALQQLKNMGAMQTALAKLKATPAPGEAQMQKSEAQANSKYKDTVITDATAARQIGFDTDNITASLHQAFAGYTGSLANWSSEGGQELKKHISQLVLDKLQGMHNVSRGTNLLTRIIKQSKPSDWMKRGAIERIVSGMAAVSHRSLERERFTQYMWDHGMTDRIKIDNMFNDYDRKYPLINVKNNTVNTQNVGRWAEYLMDKQRKARK